MQVINSLADKIMEVVHQTELPFKLDAITKGDGNCFSRGVTQQCRRKPVQDYLTANQRSQTSFMKLKRDVCKFMMAESEVPMMVTFKREFEARQREVRLTGERADSWEQYWEKMQRNGEWADAVFVQATAWYLQSDIILIPTTATLERPFFTISGNCNSETVSCPGPPVILGYKNGVHYQSVLPIDEEQERPEILDPQSIDCVLKDVIAVKERELHAAGDKSTTVGGEKSSKNEPRSEESPV